MIKIKNIIYINEGQPLIHNGLPPPQPWSIPVNPSQMYKDETRLVEIPNTSRIEVNKRKHTFIKLFF